MPGVGKIRCLAYFDSHVWACGWEPFVRIFSKDVSFNIYFWRQRDAAARGPLQQGDLCSEAISAVK